MAALPHLLKLPCSIRELVDKNFIDDWISLQLISELGSDYSTPAFDLYYWLFNKKYETETIDMSQLHGSLASLMGYRRASSASMIKELEKIILLDYLGVVPTSEKEQVRKDLDLKLTEINLESTRNTEEILDFENISRDTINKVNRHECFDYIGSQLRALVSGNRLEVLQLRVMGNIYLEEVEKIDMSDLADKLKEDLGPHCGIFVSRLQHFLLTKSEGFNEKPQGLLLK